MNSQDKKNGASLNGRIGSRWKGTGGGVSGWCLASGQVARQLFGGWSVMAEIVVSVQVAGAGGACWRGAEMA